MGNKRNKISMAKKYEQTIIDLEKALKEIESKGISITPLNNAIEELKSHSDNISAIEENIEAVRSEVLNPINLELEQNKKAGKFSVMGFYVGIFGLVVTAISLLYTTFKNPNQPIIQNPIDTPRKVEKTQNFTEILSDIANSLNEMNYSIQGLDENYDPTGKEFLINQLNEAIILKSDTLTLSVKAYIIEEEKHKDRYYPMVSLSFLINGKQLGTKGINEIVKLNNKSGVSRHYLAVNSVLITENDEFTIFDQYRYRIERIYRKQSQILTVADKKEAVIITKLD